MPRAEVRVFVIPKKATHSSGYRVELFDDKGKLVDEHSAGGNPHDSHAVGASPLNQVRNWAKFTAEGMFQAKFGRKPHKREIDLENEYPGEGSVHTIAGVSLDDSLPALRIQMSDNSLEICKVSRRVAEALKFCKMPIDKPKKYRTAK